MITHSSIYWITRLDGLKSMFSGFSITFGILAVIMIIVGLIFKGVYLEKISVETQEGREDALVKQYKNRHGWIFRSGITLLASMFLLIVVNTLLPNMKEMAAIIIIPKVANAESVQDFGIGIVDLAKDWMQELRPNAVKRDVKAVANGVSEAAKTVKNAVKDVKETAESVK